MHAPVSQLPCCEGVEDILQRAEAQGSGFTDLPGFRQFRMTGMGHTGATPLPGLL